MNVCMVGHGMMGTWHSDSIAATRKGYLHTLVGRDPDKTAQFAQKYGYLRWTTDYSEAVASPEIDVVIIAGPSATHASMALEALRAGKHALVEIPLALSLADAQEVVDLAEKTGLKLGVVHPMRFRREHLALCDRVRSGIERVRHVHSRLFLHRLENVGSTGLVRTWTDNLLWHHGAHLVDVGLWLTGAGDTEASASRITRSFSTMSDAHPKTGIQMELAAIFETGPEQSIVCTGSYHSRERIFDIFVVTDKDSYRLDILAGTLTTGAGTTRVESEKDNNAHVARDFLDAVTNDRAPAITGKSVIPAMRLLQQTEDAETKWRDGRKSQLRAS
uniref:Gfo/Idh/MocA family protein n=1 Tax=Mesorhizobium sp. WSM4875 TaxID=3038539 RepID=UPI0024168D5F|nr:Gfo/Idh/MocA family oxidoreductase [Mesorhizobium sp. WSM4875]WIE94649.1 Gfo/Idh/MocA family oxidoreductase [Mesorhizobium sp. WSM4875]